MTLGRTCVMAAVWAGLAAAQTLLVLNKEGTLAIVDPASGKVLGKVGTGDGPHEVVASPDGKLAVVSNYGSGPTPGHTLSVIDLVNKKELHRVELGYLGRPHGLYFADGKAYFTSEANKLVGRYDPAKNAVDWMVGTGQDGTHMVGLTKDQNVIYTANIASDSLSLFQKVPGLLGWKHTVVAVGKGPEGVDLSPDGKQLWAGNSRDGSVSIVDVASKKVVQTFDVGTKRSNRLKFTPDGQKVLISDLEAGDLLVVDVPSKKVMKKMPVGKGLAGILIQPDGARAYAAATGDNKVAIIDLKTMAVTGHLETGTGPDGMDWIAKQ